MRHQIRTRAGNSKLRINCDGPNEKRKPLRALTDPQLPATGIFIFYEKGFWIQ